MAPGLDGVEIIKFRVAAYDRKVHGMAFFDDKRAEDFIQGHRGFQSNHAGETESKIMHRV